MVDDAASTHPGPRHTVSIVIPVYRGATTLDALLAEIAPLAEGFTTAAGHHATVTEALLVYDNGDDKSPEVMRRLESRYSFVRNIWLSRNFGQHATTIAGMASTGGEWIATLDEDGQHDPRALADMLDVAMARRADVVYAKPTNRPPHGVLRNTSSRAAKRTLKLFAGGLQASDFQSYRLILGELGRSVAAYAGPGVYLDVAVGWVAGRVATCPAYFRREGGRPSGYSYRTLASHFWRMVVSSGTRALRIVSLLGMVFAGVGLCLTAYLLVAALVFDVALPQGWPSLMVTLLLCSGAILFALGVIAEYVGTAVNMAMGKPLYLIVSDPQDGPLGRQPSVVRADPVAATIPSSGRWTDPQGARNS